MEKHLYICQFCQEEFKPTRRKAQKFCSATCRSKNHHHKNKAVLNGPNTKLTEDNETEENNKTEIGKMSVSGVGNSALGTLLADTATALAKKAFISEEKKPATKGDIDRLESKINNKIRFELIINEPTNEFGQHAYFDHITKFKVYRGVKKHLHTSPHVI